MLSVGGIIGGVSGGGSSIGWSSDVLRGRASGAERVEISTNAEFTNGTEAIKESQEVTLYYFSFLKSLYNLIILKVADLKASVMSMQAEFTLQLAALR